MQGDGPKMDAQRLSARLRAKSNTDATQTALIETIEALASASIAISALIGQGPLAGELAASTGDANADGDQQKALDKIRDIFQGYVMIPALKAAVAHYGGDQEWARLRPPLVELTADEQADLAKNLDAAGFSMPGLA